MQLVILAILVITENYIDKIVLNPGRGTQVKEIDTDLLTQLKVATVGIENPTPDLVTKLIQNQNNENNSMFNFAIESKQATQFQSTQ